MLTWVNCALDFWRGGEPIRESGWQDVPGGFAALHRPGLCCLPDQTPRKRDGGVQLCIGWPTYCIGRGL